MISLYLTLDEDKASWLSHRYRLLFPTSVLKFGSETVLYLAFGRLLAISLFCMCFQGLVLLVYPLLGHLTDVYVTRYRTLKCGAGIVAGEMTFFLLVIVTV